MNLNRADGKLMMHHATSNDTNDKKVFNLNT